MSKKISAAEKLEIYENFFQRMHFLRHVAQNDNKVAAMLHIIDDLVMNQARNNAAGQPFTKEEIAANTKAALERMRVLP